MYIPVVRTKRGRFHFLHGIRTLKGQEEEEDLTTLHIIVLLGNTMFED